MPKRRGEFYFANNKLKDLMKRETIKPYFPQNAKTTCRTQVPFHYAAEAISMTNGIAQLGYMQVDNLKDPFGTIDSSAVGVLNTDSVWETTGHDELDLIYDSYQVTSSKASIFAQFINSSAQNQLYGLACVPATTSGFGATIADKTDLLNHPLIKHRRFKGGTGTSHPYIFLSYSIMHHSFLKLMYHEEDLRKNPDLHIHEWIDFNDGATTNSNVFLHWFLYSVDSTHDDTTMDIILGGNMTVMQKLKLDRSTGSSPGKDQDLLADYVPRISE